MSNQPTVERLEEVRTRALKRFRQQRTKTAKIAAAKEASKAQFEIEKLKVKAKFESMPWNKENIFSHTSGCGYLSEAIRHLARQLTEDEELLPYARKLVSEAYERDWEPAIS